jgi:hypothetical protein
LKGPDPPPTPDRPSARRRSSKFMSFAMDEASRRSSSTETQVSRLEFPGQIPSRGADLEQKTAGKLRLEVSRFFRIPSTSYPIQHTEAEKESVGDEPFACE